MGFTKDSHGSWVLVIQTAAATDGGASAALVQFASYDPKDAPPASATLADYLDQMLCRALIRSLDVAGVVRASPSATACYACDQHGNSGIRAKRIAVVTGANSGIGRVTVSALLAQGFRVIATARSKERGARPRWPTGRENSRTPPSRVELVLCDLSKLEAVREAARDIARRVDRIHVLVNNAGGIIGERRVTKDGLEETFAGNHLGAFVLTRDLMPLLERGAPARIVNVASEAHKSVPDMQWDDLQFANGYNSLKVYGQSKLANILFTRELARRNDPAKLNGQLGPPRRRPDALRRDR